jgi:aldehyde:ferredoxin oxidoreductase
LKEETGENKARVVAIGPAGEKCSLISCPINDGHRAPGRGGVGAVMGSKKLKAIVVRGTKTIDVADPDKIMDINKRIAAVLKENQMAQAIGAYGTGVGTLQSALNGDSPVKNWAGAGIVDFDESKASKMTSTTIDRYKTKKYACASCPLGCGAEYEVNDGRWPVGPTERPEYETAAAFGSAMLCDEEDAMIKCNEICNRYGMDTISAGMTIAWAMECYNVGLITKNNLDGDWTHLGQWRSHRQFATENGRL